MTYEIPAERFKEATKGSPVAAIWWRHGGKIVARSANPRYERMFIALLAPDVKALFAGDSSS